MVDSRWWWNVRLSIVILVLILIVAQSLKWLAGRYLIECAWPPIFRFRAPRYD
jgi:hypothetical protein